MLFRSEELERLWTLDGAFRAFAQELASRGGANLNGDDLREADKDHATRLFAGFEAEEQEAIRKGGKIPNVGQWIGRASLDDLMTEAALQSFIVDQAALDNRIRSLIG